MAAEHTRELQAGEQHAISPFAEQTRPGPVLTPAVDIFETETALTVVADLPGVKAPDPEIIPGWENVKAIPIDWNKDVGEDAITAIRQKVKDAGIQ